VDSDIEFGSFEMETDLSNKVNTALSALKDSSGEQVTISRSAYNELQRIKREFAEAGGEVRGEVSTKILSSLGELLASLPSVKSEKEVAKYVATKTRKVNKDEVPSGFTN
jgi:BMFP domain-containing protein YqiC